MFLFLSALVKALSMLNQITTHSSGVTKSFFFWIDIILRNRVTPTEESFSLV